ncbi:hypothetical protein ACT4YA_18345 [Acinetobacter baumannii]|uniref:Uncharacterized protein n=4 Tax=Acinetobacter baumannii TaxID=470 RepID=A0A7S8ZVF5_ACIBA|nr:hypothetical protein [Acinetobacter baumannii]MCZ2961282.1 hypothetical protein [Acinetobacter baumannii]MDC4344237.1 hypothetical protein [Acinetobacter baumannii]MDV4269481.1 hypothetical protein [Acinetobacter baumannii]QPF14592.1 hypothetical protein IMO23_06710 [Acinetobacter baumannii]HCQ9571063.1 hypothetical protein [Acinetobacter baumannii]
MNENKAIFIKPNHLGLNIPKLDPVLINSNKKQGIETTLVLDSNILIKMERVVKAGNKWSSVKENGLDNLIKLLQKCNPYSVCLSPGFALKEMPPQKAKISMDFYENFCSVHLPNFVDTPNSTRKAYTDFSSDYGFVDLTTEAKLAFVLPYLNFLYLNYIEYCYSGTPIEKFKAYVDLLEEKVDLLSATEIEVAKYCFFNTTNLQEGKLKKFCQKIRENSVKYKNKRAVDINQIKQIAFNGASDIHLLHVTNAMDKKLLDNIKQDCWLVTMDKKLAAFCDLFHQISVNGVSQPYAMSTISEEMVNDEYWQSANEYFLLKSIKRREYHLSREFNLENLLPVVEDAISMFDKDFKSI